jgi:hypothetical protein
MQEGTSGLEELEDCPKKSTDGSVPWNLGTDQDGWPILPIELALPLRHLKEILRSFVTITYREFIPCWCGEAFYKLPVLGNASGNKNAAVPWQQIYDNQHHFIDPQFLPIGVHLREPSKMHFQDIKMLCDFFLNKQSLGLPVFRFQRVLPQHQIRSSKLPMARSIQRAQITIRDQGREHGKFLK